MQDEILKQSHETRKKTQSFRKNNFA
jgi:hypothetical protein